MNALSQLLAGLDAGLDGAACAGRWGLFDGRGDRETDTEFGDRVRAAATVCRTCPILAACHETAQNLRPSQRSGIWAGIPYDGRGRPALTPKEPT